MKHLVIKSIIVIFPFLWLLFIIFFIVSHFSYVDITQPCYIGIEQKTPGGNRKTIKKAIREIKRENPSVYADLCKYVSVISERRCFNVDWHLEKEAFFQEYPGCYVKGSKYIYVRAQKDESPETVSERKAQILKYSSYAKTFWE